MEASGRIGRWSDSNAAALSPAKSFVIFGFQHVRPSQMTRPLMHIHRSVATNTAKPVTSAGRDSEIGLLPDRSAAS
jgi:hypothetical protein